MKSIINRYLTAALVLCVAVVAQAQTNADVFYSFKKKTLEGQEFDFSQLKGKKVLIVNLAPACGTASQYDELELLYQKYKSKGLIVLGFPCNDFFGQAPGTNEELITTCKRNYGFTFPVFEKVQVKGKEQDPLYAWLTKKEQNGVVDAKVKWNSQKFMIDENGKWIDWVGPFVAPDDPKIINWLENVER